MDSCLGICSTGVIVARPSRTLLEQTALGIPEDLEGRRVEVAKDGSQSRGDRLPRARGSASKAALSIM